MIVLCGQKVLVFRESTTRGPQCVALTAPPFRRRCRQVVLTGRSDERRLHPVEGGQVEVLVPNRTDPRLFEAQICLMHARMQQVETAPVEWDAFHAALHGHLIDTRHFLTERTLSVDEVRYFGLRRDGWTDLYRFYDADGVLLYIGITENLRNRFRTHRNMWVWADFAETVRVVPFADRGVAEHAERAAIRAEQPLFNGTFNDSPEVRRKAVLYLIGKDRIDLLTPAMHR